jgi:hypothetical protein
VDICDLGPTPSRVQDDNPMTIPPAPSLPTAPPRLASPVGVSHPMESWGSIKQCYANTPKAKAQRKVYWLAHRDEAAARCRRNNLRGLYGLTPEKVNELFDQQNGVCAICEHSLLRPAPTTKKTAWTAHVDHDHISGRVRGLLCHHCNCGLGNFTDNVFILQQAIQYLKEQYK